MPSANTTGASWARLEGREVRRGRWRKRKGVANVRLRHSSHANQCGGLPILVGAPQTAPEKVALQRHAEAIDRQIDKLVYELYGFSEGEIGTDKAASDAAQTVCSEGSTLGSRTGTGDGLMVLSALARCCRSVDLVEGSEEVG